MHDQRISRGEKPCNHHPSPAEEDCRVESAVLAFVLDEHPDHLTPLELAVVFGSGTPEVANLDGINRATDALIGAGLLRKSGPRARLRFDPEIAERALPRVSGAPATDPPAAVDAETGDQVASSRESRRRADAAGGLRRCDAKETNRTGA